MGTPLYTTDIIPMTSRPTLTVMDDGDYFVILDTSTGKISKILKTLAMEALKISYDNTTSGLTAETVQAALDELVVNLGSSDDAILALSGRLDTLEGTGEGSVAKAIDDAVSPLEEDITDHEERIAQNESDIGTLEGVVDTNRLYSDSQYLDLKAKYEAQQIALNASKAELYTDDPILQYGATGIIGKGYETDDTQIDVSANVVDGKLSMEQKGLTITNLVDGAGIADSGTVSFNTVNGDKYFDTLNETIITGDGTEMSATNSSGATANMAIYHLNALGLDHITDTAILAKLLPYVDGTKNVGKMGMRVVGKNLFNIVAYAQRSTSARIVMVDSATIKTINSGGSLSAYGKIRLIPGIYRYSTITATGARVQITSMDSVNIYDNNAFRINATGTFTIITDGFYYIKIVSADGGLVSNINLSLGSSAIPYEPYQEQLTFLPAIGNSLPNGVADSIKTVADGWEHSKRVSTPASVGSGVAVNTTNYPTAKNGGQWVNELTAGGTEIGVIGTDSTTGAGTLRFELATPITTHYDLPILTSGKTIHRFAGEEKIALYGTGLTFSENVLTVLSAVKFVAGVMTDITDLATITDDTVTFSGVSTTDVVYVKVEHSVNRPLGILEHTPAVSNTASRLASLEARVSALEA